VKPRAFSLALTASGVIASSRKAWPCTIAARGPNCCVSRSPEVIERIKACSPAHAGKEIDLTVGVFAQRSAACPSVWALASSAPWKQPI
jgi:hypothetical protein